MRRNLPPLNALLAFEAAARHGNFTRAAEELSVAQPAVTRHISNVESWIGARLFTRRGSRIELTGEGQRLAELSTSAFDRLELGIREIGRTKRDEFGRRRIIRCCTSLDHAPDQRYARRVENEHQPGDVG